MKKAFALILSIVMMLSLAIPAFAEEIAETKQTVVSLELDPALEHYTLTIPATIELDMAKDVNEIPVTLTDVTFCWNRRLYVYVTAKNACEEAWETEVDDPEFGPSSYLIHTEDENKKILYGIKDINGSYYESENGVEAAHADFNDNNELRVHDGPLQIKIFGDYPGAGTYTDTLTFTVKLSR